MDNDLKDKKRHTIPRWRDYETTRKLGELNSSKRKFNVIKHKSDIALFEEKIEDWNNNKSMAFAIEVVQSAIVFDLYDKAIDSAKYIIENQTKVSESLLKQANTILGTTQVEPPACGVKNIFPTIKEKVRNLKVKVREYPNNPIFWSDLALSYTNLGQLNKAEKCITVAFSLAKNNRYILRSASRFYFHNNDPEKALSILRSSGLIKVDPWILSAEISIASSLQKSSFFTKNALSIIESENYSPFSLSEITSALGTLEYEYGSLKQAKKFIKKSLVEPNDNSLAQAIFLSKNVNGIFENGEYLEKCPCPYEAEAFYNYMSGKWEATLQDCLLWQNDIPYSSRSAILGSHVSASLLMDYEQSEMIAEYGRISNPDDNFLLNNLIFAKLNLEKTDEAKQLIDKIDFNNFKNIYEEIVLNATKGMYYFRHNCVSEGRKYYSHAIDICNKNNEVIYKISAYIHWAYEEKRLNTEEAKYYYKIAETELKNNKDKYLIDLFFRKFGEKIN